jgi:vancomycin aglycone glucosyltransferase
VEPLLGLALELRAQGVDVRMCAPPDFAERLAEVGVPFVPIGFPAREWPPSRHPWRWPRRWSPSTST